MSQILTSNDCYELDHGNTSVLSVKNSLTFQQLEIVCFVLTIVCYLLTMPLGDLVNLQLKMASSPIWAVLCSLGPTLSSSFAAGKRSTATSSPARSQASTSTSYVTPFLTIQ